MSFRKVLSTALVCVSMIACLSVEVNAAEDVSLGEQFSVARASGQFDTTVPASSVKRTGNQFQMLPGETVSIQASYSPGDASVDFGILDSDNIFYYVRTGDGSIDTEIEITERGTYTFAIRNNSSQPISVSGYVNY